MNQMQDFPSEILHLILSVYLTTKAIDRAKNSTVPRNTVRALL